MNARVSRTAAVEPDMTLAWEQLQASYTRHRNSAPFWSAYQAIQNELMLSHPKRCIDVCNQLATLAERLGVVAHAQLLGSACPESFSDGRHTGSTSP
ncbi:hypothetical protein ACPEH7_00265 [Stenotrophomonas sp. NPDC101269]|uniref:hypothetical protein n=1 Tax=Stenotrophomonas TaxID=40323 RepID=UPI0012922AB4|nr:hypothetical protein [Stenotrophomonas nematodicola]